MSTKLENVRMLFLTSRYLSGYGVSLVIQKQLAGLRALGLKNITVAASDVLVSTSKQEENIIPVGQNYEDVSKLIRKVQPDMVVAHTPPFYTHVAQYSDPKLLKIAYDYGEPFPTFFTEFDVRENINRHKFNAIRQFHGHISISNFIKRTSGFPDSQVNYLGAEHIVENIADLKIDIRAHLGLKKDDILITTLSRIGMGESCYKGFDIIKIVKARLCQALPGKEIIFLICGKLALGGKKIKQELENLGCKVLLDLEENMKQAILQQSDIYLSTSLWEGFDLPLVEAQYLGTPALALSTGAHPEVCPYHYLTIYELTEQLKKLCRNSNLKKTIGQQCKQFVQKKFTWQHSILDYKNILENIIDLGPEQPQLQTGNDNMDSSADKEGVEKKLANLQQSASVEIDKHTGINRIRYKHRKKPLVSIIIPNHDHHQELEECIHSIKELSTYSNYEIMVIENRSHEIETFELYKQIEQDSRIEIIKWDHPFNFSAINNFGVKRSQGEIILFLNNDMQVITSDWLESMLEHAQRKEVGAVGAKLYYEDNTIQHAGVILGIGGIAAHGHRGLSGNEPGYMGRLQCVQNLSAVTAACLMMRKTVFAEVGGFDEEYSVAFNDVDLCLKIRQKGYLILWTPYAELYHFESKTRGLEDTPRKQERFKKEIELFKKKWESELVKGDPYYSLNLTLKKADFSIRL